MTTHILDPYDALPSMEPGDIAVRPGEVVEGFGSDVTVHANGIVVEVVSNEDGTVYIEAYAYRSRTEQAVVQSAYINAYKHPHPSLTLGLADRPSVEAVR